MKRLCTPSVAALWASLPIGVGRAATAGLLALALIGVLSACGDRKGTSTAFVQSGTDNTDFVQYAIPTGDRPIGLTVADFNEDGLTDFAVSNYLDGTISIYTGIGGHAFSVQTVGVGPHPTLIEFADLDGGGPTQLDLVVVTETSLVNSVVVVLNNGTTFTATPPMAMGTVIEQMTVACMQTPCANGSAADVVLSLPKFLSIRVLANDGFGGFRGLDSGLGLNTGQFVVADFNGDGKPDVAVTLPANDVIQVLLGSGDGTFFSSTRYPTDKYPSVIVAAPLRSSPVIDLAVSCRDSARVKFFFGDGAGSFIDAGSLDVTKLPERLIAGNFSGTEDVVVVNRGEENLTYFKGDGAGGFVGYNIPASKDPFDLAAGDFSGDGSPDFVVVELVKRVLGVNRGDGAGGFFRTQIGFESQIAQPRRVNICGGTKDDLLLVQSFSDRVLLFCNVN